MCKHALATYQCANPHCPEPAMRYEVVGVMEDGTFKPMEADSCPICGHKGHYVRAHEVSAEDAGHMMNPFWTC